MTDQFNKSNKYDISTYLSFLIFFPLATHGGLLSKIIVNKKNK